jgi:hypothetical protein
VPFRIPSLAIANLFVLLVLHQPVFGQPASSIERSQIFSVHGTIADQTGGVIPGTRVSFQSDLLTKEALTNNRGIYEVDLPLGVYTMIAEYRGFNVFHRPPFRVAKPTSITFDATLIVASTCDMEGIDPTGEAHKAACAREESFLIPSEDHVPFQLYIHYGTRSQSGSTYFYGNRKGRYDEPVFVAYNLCSLQADNVVYNAALRVLEAKGNVIVVGESSHAQRADSLVFKIEGGQAVRLR